MDRKCVISAGQLFGALLLSSLITVISADSARFGLVNIWDDVLACAAVFAANVVFAVPIWLLFQRYPKENVLDCAGGLAMWWGKAVAVFYAAYFLLMAGCELAEFGVFQVNTVAPELPSWLPIAAVLLAALYAAYRGIEPTMRAAVLLLALVLLGVVLIVGTAAVQVNRANFMPPFYQGGAQTVQTALLLFGRGSGLAVMAMLLPWTAGRKKTGFALWNGAAGLCAGLLLLVTVGVLGNAVQTQLFPVHTLAAVAGIGPFQRMDSVFLGIWTVGVFVKAALYLYLFGFCMRRVFSLPKQGFFFIGGAIFMGIFSGLIAKFAVLRRFCFGVSFTVPLTLVAGVVIPLVLLLLCVMRDRTAERLQKLPGGAV